MKNATHKSFHLPKIANNNNPHKKEEEYEFVEMEKSVEEEFSVEVSDDEMPLPQKPNNNGLQIV